MHIQFVLLLWDQITPRQKNMLNLYEFREKAWRRRRRDHVLCLPTTCVTCEHSHSSRRLTAYTFEALSQTILTRSWWFWNGFNTLTTMVFPWTSTFRYDGVGWSSHCEVVGLNQKRRFAIEKFQVLNNSNLQAALNKFLL